MIRKALEKDVPAAAANYRELLTYEKENGTNSNWVLDLYPTRETAEKAWQAGTLYVLEEDGEICGSVILNQLQPAEYEGSSGIRSSSFRIKAHHPWRLQPGNPCRS